ncbi:winged helix-turn-helix domain-containing protein [Nocardia sp. CDC159]|uniref:Winged helix-turn-helix domain-containing protein n=1 Tax=Nocardia pulmonis TaxID=2951408 RepID=A0A9X2E9K7_9NOCA|nr:MULTISPECIES: BTAD domain-containing putative transcriptional regulator [Nocardia]MCM6776284.1 winged helix-turn-helix domain-containing protein [Nocardia pulmonis]MCM6788708.1 winged helix-turn-helix domain-containing protein [Nocardia sp. CDC159]
MDEIAFGVLGPVTARGGDGAALGLRGPRHRAVLARLIVARRRVVPVARLVADLWEEPPTGAVGAVQTFVADLRRVLEPDRPRRAPARLLVTEGPGYALRAAPDAVDAWRFEAEVRAAADLPPARALELTERALGRWRGPSYAELAPADWLRAERSRLAELRAQAIERQAEARLTLGAAAAAIPDLDEHVRTRPERESAWELLALALYRAGRQADALEMLRRARAALADRLGLDPGPRLRRLEADILAHDPRLDPPVPQTAAARVWNATAAAYDRVVSAGARARLDSTVGLLRDLAVTGGGGLEAAREQRPAAIAAAEEFGDPELTARVIGAYDVPAIWTRSDDPVQAGRIVAAAERTLAALPADRSRDAVRCRLLATIALETRGSRSPRGPRAARQAEEIARRLDEPALLAFALNGTFMQSCTRAGYAARRDEIGAELVELAARHDLPTFEILGHLIRVQARGALADYATADRHAAAADRLAERDERPLTTVFTEWYRALRTAATGRSGAAELAYRNAAARLVGAGMPGVERGLLPLALLCVRLSDPSGSALEAAEHVDLQQDWGPYRPWGEPFALLGEGRIAEAGAALRALAEPPADLMYEALTCLEAAAALAAGERTVLRRAHTRLLPAAGECAAGSGLVTVGPVRRWLTAIESALE